MVDVYLERRGFNSGSQNPFVLFRGSFVTEIIKTQFRNVTAQKEEENYSVYSILGFLQG